MKLRLLLSVLTLLAATGPALRAQENKNAGSDMLGGFVAGDTLDSLSQKIRAKAGRGLRSAGDYAPELKELDESAARFADDKEFAAQFVFMKAMLHAEVIGDLPRAREVLLALKRTHPGTDAANNADQIIAALEAAIERDAATPELKPLVELVMQKVQAGARTEAALAAEIKKFDALVVKYANTPRSAAAVALSRALLYAQVLGQPDKGRDMLLAVAKKYPDTEGAAAAQQAADRMGAPPPAGQPAK